MSVYYFYKGDQVSLNKLCGAIGRIDGANFSNWTTYGGIIFTLSEKLDRKFKLMKINDVSGKKKYQKLLSFLLKSKKFQSMEDVNKYLHTLTPAKTNTKYHYSQYEYNVMPKDPQKDNQKVYTLEEKESKWDKIEDKKKLIKAGNRVYGIKARRPRKTASKRKWKNFLKKFNP